MAIKNLGRVVGENGRGIERIEKTGSQGLTDIYTIFYSDGTTSQFQVKNGESVLGNGTGDMVASVYDPQGRMCDIFEYIDEVAADTGDKKYSDKVLYHIKGSSGSDSNDGLTESTAFRTLDHFFGLLNKGHNDIRCYIEEPGTYEVSHSLICGAVVMIEAKVSGVIINFTDTERGVELYNSILTLKGLSTLAEERMQITCGTGTIKAKNSDVHIEHCICNAELSGESTSMMIVESSLSNIIAKNNSFCYVNSTSFTTTDKNCIRIEFNSTCSLAGSLSTIVIPDSEDEAYLYVGSGSTANILQTWGSSNSTTRKSYELYYSTVNIPSGAKTAWDNKKKSINNAVFNTMSSS